MNSGSPDIEIKRRALYRDEMMATLGKIAGGMVHEFNTPLQLIKIIAQKNLRAGRLPRTPPDDLERAFREIIEAVDALDARVREIGRLARGDLIKLEAVDVNQVIRKSFYLFRHQLRNRSIHTTMDLQKQLPALTGNRFRLQQVFINLIENSRDSLKGVRNRKKEIQVRTRFIKRRNSFYRIHFSDNGPGIVNGRHKRVFDAFFTTKNPNAGMGLGLSIIKEILSDLGGSIRVLDDGGSGAAF